MNGDHEEEVEVGDFTFKGEADLWRLTSVMSDKIFLLINDENVVVDLLEGRVNDALHVVNRQDLEDVLLELVHVVSYVPIRIVLLFAIEMLTGGGVLWNVQLRRWVIALFVC